MPDLTFNIEQAQWQLLFWRDPGNYRVVLFIRDKETGQTEHVEFSHERQIALGLWLLNKPANKGVSDG